VPSYYTARALACDCWFRLDDIRRLVSDDTLQVVRELQRLTNRHYHDQPVSLYGGMVDLPLVVARQDGRRFFEAEARDRLLGDRLWAEFDAEQSGVGAIERELRENLFGDRLWYELDPDARTFLATAERVYRASRDEPGFDFGNVVGSLAKALEVECNSRLRKVLSGAPDQARYANLDGRSVDLADADLTLGQWANAVKNDSARQEWLRGHAKNGTWFSSVLPLQVEDFARVRNSAAHHDRIGPEPAGHWRGQLLGVGCHGVFAQLAAVQPKR
jgi:hypothetical protein